MKFVYYINSFDGRNRIYRIFDNGKIHENVQSIEIYDAGKWIEDMRSVKSFMNKYVTGWVDEYDAISNFETAQTQLLIQEYIAVKDFAISIHKNQKYGKYPYEVHLISVVGVLLRNGVFLSEESYTLLASAWLHDVIEDTTITKEEFINRFGADVYNVVWCLTDGEGVHREEKKNKMYDKLPSNQESIIVKLSDRIANIEFSIINCNTEQVLKYISENDKLNFVLNGIIKTDLGLKLLNYLNVLVENAKKSV